MKNTNCCHGKDAKHKCGEFSGNEDTEEKLKHLTECKKELLLKIDEIDETIAKLEK